MVYPDRAKQHSGLDLEYMGQREQVSVATHHEGHTHQGEGLPHKGKGRTANHASNTGSHAHISRNAYEGRPGASTGKNHSQLPCRHHNEFFQRHGRDRSAGIGVGRHKGYPLDKNQG